jgi:hydrogenase-4 membrane subunit HyfE
MGEVISDGLFLPTLMLALCAFAVPRLLARVLPEGVPALMANALLSALAMCVLSAVFFFCLYVWQGAPVQELLANGLAHNVVSFGGLGMIAGIIWAPIMLLSVAGLPRRWVHKTW